MVLKLHDVISVRKNAIANYIGTFCQGVLGFLFVPLYIKYLGVENYGLVGFSVSIQAMLRLVDLGLSSTLSRELARYSISKKSAEPMRSLLKTLQTVYWIISVVVGVLIVFSAPVIVKYWINLGSISANTVRNSVVLMGLSAAAQGPMSLYIGGLFGLQKHVLGNWVNIIIAVLRSGGCVLALIVLSPTITTFFVYQFCITLLGALGSGMILWNLLPPSINPSRFQLAQLKQVWQFAAGMSINSVLWFMISQSDKIILIKILPLESFGYYAVASTAAAAVLYISGPIFSTFLPRYTQLFATNDFEELRRTYRTSCKLNALILIPTALFLAIYSYDALFVWTRNPVIAKQAHLILSLLVIGYGLNQLAYLPYALQIAAGWVKLGVYTNAVIAIFIIPVLVCATRIYGGVGAALVWIAINSVYVLIFVNVLHRRILVDEARRWYASISNPLFLSVGVSVLGQIFLPSFSGIGVVFYVTTMWAVVIGVGIMITPDIRKLIPVIARR